jgi:argininosuccinate lyase
MKLWQKDGAANDDTAKRIERFTAGKDKEFDHLLAEYDVIGSLAHVRMLRKINLLKEEEFVLIEKELNVILKTIRAGKFQIEEGMEDIHSQVEFMLTKAIGEAGKKIHSGRSRNDQVLVDIKLFLRKEIVEIADLAQTLFNTLQSLSEKHKDKLMPGYTHFQVAMPSSFGLWFGAYAESLVDDLEMLGAAYRIANKNPLGSGAGYGSSFPLDRKLTTELLGFESLNYNVVYAQMTRGKTEKATAMALATIGATLGKFAYDVCLYMNQNFGFIRFPDELTTGSSIMPHKKNPDVFELIRARCNRIQALPNELSLLLVNLPSGYHRDLQLTKECLFPALNEMKDCIAMTDFMLQQIEIKENILGDEKYAYLWSVEAVNQLVLEGVPFREAYKKVGKAIEAGEFSYPEAKPHTHEGSMGNLCTSEIGKEMKKVMALFKSR